MPWWDHARRLALPCALTITFITAVAGPSSAQERVPEADSAIESAAREALTVGREWLGPPRATIDVAARAPLWQGPGAMAVERQVAQQVIRSWWPSPIADAEAGEMLDGFAWYLQAAVVEHLFDLRYRRLAHSVETRPYLGGHLIWSFPPLRLSRAAAAAPTRYAAVFAGLERWIGAPALQGAMAEVARLSVNELTAATIIKTISDAAGQDVAWAFDPAMAGHEINYAVTGLSSTAVTACPAPCVETTVVVTRDGDGIFPGRSARRSGAFDAGDGLVLVVTFADRSTVSARWDGRDRSRTFTFRGPVPATAAHLDPDHLVTLDRNRLDNAIVRPAPTNVPVGKWAARWMVWLQHTMLSYGFLA